MDSIFEQIEEWLREVLVSGIMDNLANTFTSVNDQVGQIASDCGFQYSWGCQHQPHTRNTFKCVQYPTGDRYH